MRVKCNAGLDIYYNGENAHIIVPYVQENIELVDELTETERGSNGFGSTGTH